MKAIEILYNLTPYQNLLQELLERARTKEPDKIYSGCLKSQYDFITLELSHRLMSQPENQERLFQKITFQIKQGKVTLNETYCEDQIKKAAIENLIKENKEVHEARWHNNPNNTWYHNEQTTAYINVADEIASPGLLCNSGDDYRPGAFSEIKVKDDHICLKQINHLNARSIDHKENYMLRDLLIFVPLKETMPPIETMDYKIGEMYISFSDRSSTNNKECGKNILEQILKQKELADQ